MLENGSRPLRFDAMAQTVRAIWAKSGEGMGHGLVAHLLDVAATAEVILLHESPATLRLVAEEFGMSPEQSTRWVAALVGLHDFGKAIPGFQAKWPEGRQRDEQEGLHFDLNALSCDNHSLATAALLTPHLQTLGGASYLWCLHVVQAVSAHHGYHFMQDEIDRGRPRKEGVAWSQARQDIIEMYWASLSLTGEPRANALTLPMVNWLAGLTSVADWIASNPVWFPFGERGDDLSAHYEEAQRLAGAALKQIGWTRYRPLLQELTDVDELIARIVRRKGIQARPLQHSGDLLLRAAKGPALLLVEAPMGEGKTELAFLAHLRLQAANQHRGLYVALPTQATGNALFKRAHAFLEGFASGPLDIQLVHGGAAMNEDLAMLRDIDHSRHETLSASAWFGQRRRPLLSPYGVGTVDQLLYSVLNVKHHFVRLWGLSNRVVVLDEIHAYDVYTLGLITTLLRWLKALRCSVVLMSATLPQERRRELVAAWGVDQPEQEQPYPRLTFADEAGVRSVHVSARPLPPIELVGLDSSLEAIAEAAWAQLAGDGCGAIIVNTVKRAQTLYLALQARMLVEGRTDVTLLLFHARFPADERALLEQRVLSMFAQDGDRPSCALLVATQVVEQSLDIDFDFMFSDLAPVDLLIQRAGRLHRHTRLRPETHACAKLYVAGLLPGAVPELKKTAWGFVYEPYILARTWALLTRETVLHLPEDIDRLVQAVYDSSHELPLELAQAARSFIEDESYGEHLARVQRERMLAWHIAVDPASEPHSAYDGKPRGHEEDELGLGLANATRLGRESISIVPVSLGDDGCWHVRPADNGFAPNEVLDVLTARALYNRQIKISDSTLVRHFKASEVPLAFASHALLRHSYPLCLEQDQCVIESQTLTLSETLGLVVAGEGEVGPLPQRPR